MMQAKLVACTRIERAGRVYLPGDSFVCSTEEARQLIEDMLAAPPGAALAKPRPRSWVTKWRDGA